MHCTVCLTQEKIKEKERKEKKSGVCVRVRGGERGGACVLRTYVVEVERGEGCKSDLPQRTISDGEDSMQENIDLKNHQFRAIQQNKQHKNSTTEPKPPPSNPQAAVLHSLIS
jgi:hypothetical protein